MNDSYLKKLMDDSDVVILAKDSNTLNLAFSRILIEKNVEIKNISALVYSNILDDNCKKNKSCKVGEYN